MTALLLALQLCLGQTFAADRTSLERQLDDLRQEASTAFAHVATDRAALKKKGNEKGNDEKAQSELWDRRSYWTHYMDLVLELRKASAKMDLSRELATRLAAAQRALKNTGVHVLTTEDGHVSLDPEPSSYTDRENALKSAAASAVYSRLQ